MGNLLSGFTGDKGKPVIYNGKLLMYGKKRVLVKNDKHGNFRPVFIVESSKEGTINLTTGEGMEVSENEEATPYRMNEAKLTEMILSFDKKYAKAWGRDPEAVSAKSISVNIDTYTGAIVLESELFRKMMDPDDFHRTDRAYNAAEQRVRAEILLEYIDNYYEIYTHLLHSRLMGPRMTYYVKGHLVEGLFQPLLVATDLIRSPLDYPILSTIWSIIRGEMSGLSDGLGDIEIHLLPSADEPNIKGLKLTCASTYEFSKRFYVERDGSDGSAVRPLIVPQRLDRRLFIYIMLRLACSIIDPSSEGRTALEAHHPMLERTLVNNKSAMAFAKNIIEAYYSLASQIAVR